MNTKELREKLLQIEDYERESYRLWQENQKRAAGTEEIWEAYQKKIEGYIAAYEEKGLKNQIPILDYQSEGSGRSGVSYLTDRGRGQLVIPSRALVAEKQGIKKWMMIQKHGRYWACFYHRHSFLEINYCYSGQVINEVNGKKIVMKPGDLLLMEPGCVHKINVLRKEDILINLVCFPSAMLTVLEKLLPGKCELSQFLSNAVCHIAGNMNYLFLRTSQDRKIQEEIEELLAEYYDPEQIAAKELFEQLIHTVFVRLWRFIEQNPELIFYNYRPDSKVSRMIAYIREHCADCTRESVAEHFGYSESWVSSLLTEHLGISFVRLRNEFRLERVEELLRATELPVQTIAEQNGFFNQSHFYRLYKEYFGRLPRQETGAASVT